MRAIVLNGCGSPEPMTLAYVPRPVACAGEIILRVRLTAVNPADGKRRARDLAEIAPISFPHILGYDVAGETADGRRVAAMLDRFDAVADAIGGPLVGTLCRHLALGGRICTAATSDMPSGGLSDIPRFRAVRPDGAQLQRLLADVTNGTIAMPIAARYRSPPPARRSAVARLAAVAASSFSSHEG